MLGKGTTAFRSMLRQGCPGRQWHHSSAFGLWLGYKSIVEELLNGDVQTDLRDYRGCTPLDVAWSEDIRVLLGDD